MKGQAKGEQVKEAREFREPAGSFCPGAEGGVSGERARMKLIQGPWLC